MIKIKNAIKMFVLTSTLLVLSSCDPFEGLFSVKKDFVVNSFENQGTVKVRIPAGDQNVKLEFINRNQIQMKLKIDGRTRYVTMTIPQNHNIPTENGTFKLEARDLNQTFDLTGVVATEVTESELMKGYESCTYQRYEQICNVINNQVTCYDRPVTVNGQQYVEYTNKNTDQQLKVKFVERTTTLALFDGAKSYSERQYQYKGNCF